MTRWLAVMIAVASCAKKSDAPAPVATDDRPKPTMTEAELTRGVDACKAYVAKVCKCAVDGMDATLKSHYDDYLEAHPSPPDDPAEVVVDLVRDAKIPLGKLSEPIQMCELGRALPDALRVAREVSLTANSTAKDIAQAEDSARKTIRGCFENLARLPALGCKP